MTRMFSGASSFDCDLGDWHINNVCRMDEMLDNSNLSTLMGWKKRYRTRNDITLGAYGLKFKDKKSRNELLKKKIGLL